MPEKQEAVPRPSDHVGEPLTVDRVVPPLEQGQAREMALTLSANLELAGYPRGTWLEIAAWLVALTIPKVHAVGLGEEEVQEVKNYVGRRASELHELADV